MKTDKFEYDPEMWELMRDWLHEHHYTFSLGYTFPANQTFDVYKEAGDPKPSFLIQTWRVDTTIEIMVPTGDDNWPYKIAHSLDARDPECFNKLEKLLALKIQSAPQTTVLRRQVPTRDRHPETSEVADEGPRNSEFI